MNIIGSFCSENEYCNLTQVLKRKHSFYSILEHSYMESAIRFKVIESFLVVSNGFLWKSEFYLISLCFQ